MNSQTPREKKKLVEGNGISVINTQYTHTHTHTHKNKHTPKWWKQNKQTKNKKQKREENKFDLI